MSSTVVSGGGGSAAKPPGRKKSDRPTPLDASALSAASSFECPLKSPMIKRVRHDPDGVPPSSAPPVPSASQHSLLSPHDLPQQPASARIPPQLTLSCASSPSSTGSPRPAPVRSLAFSELERRADDSAAVRQLVIQIEREMSVEIERLKATHALELETSAEQFTALADLLQRKREEWALQMAAKETCIADLQNDLIELVKSEKEAQLKIVDLEAELARQRERSEKLRELLSEKSVESPTAKTKEHGEKGASNGEGEEEKTGRSNGSLSDECGPSTSTSVTRRSRTKGV